LEAAVSDTIGIQTFFAGLGQHLVNQLNAQAFEVGDAVLYKGSHADAHGYYRVLAISPERGAVTIGRHSSDNVLTVRPQSLSRARDNGLLAPLPQYAHGTVVRYHGSREADHGHWMVVDTLDGMLRLARPEGERVRKLVCRPWSVTPTA
jgi:hypothetical protein